MKKITISILISAFVFTSIGIWASPFVIGFLTQKTNLLTTCSNNNSDNSFENGWDAARQRLIENGYMSDENKNSTDPNSLNGIITAIDSEGILTIDVTSPDLLIDPKLKTRTIQPNETTEIQTITLGQTASGSNIADSNLNNLKVGESIEVEATSPIFDQTNITPSQINIYIFDGIEIPTIEIPTDEI